MRSLLARPWLAVLIVIPVVAIVLLVRSGSDGHDVKVAFAEALNVPNGALVETNGVTVGHVKDVKNEDGQAIVRLGLDDDVWPLPRGTTAQIRLASISGNVNRRIELTLGPRGAAPIPDGGVIGAAPDKPVELDEIYNTFDTTTRRNLRGALHNMAGGLAGRTQDVNRGIAALDPALTQAGGLISDLHRSEASLSGLLRNGDAVMRVLNGRREQVGETVALANATFATFAERTGAVGRTLDALPPALDQIDHTTRRLSPSLTRLTALMHDLAPGAARLRPVAAVVTPTLASLRATAAHGSQLAKDATTAAPDITGMLRRGQPFVDKVTPIVDRLVPVAHCLRPYAPELTGLISNWDSWNANYDGTSNIGKIFVNTSLGGDLAEMPDIKSSQLTSLGIRYAQLRPPGWIGHGEQYMPECGVGKDALDPANDWEDSK